jgi:hypothetical protein
METDEKSNLATELEIVNDKIEATLGFIAGEKTKHANWKVLRAISFWFIFAHFLG